MGAPSQLGGGAGELGPSLPLPSAQMPGPFAGWPAGRAPPRALDRVVAAGGPGGRRPAALTAVGHWPPTFLSVEDSFRDQVSPLETRRSHGPCPAARGRGRWHTHLDTSERGYDVHNFRASSSPCRTGTSHPKARRTPPAISPPVSRDPAGARPPRLVAPRGRQLLGTSLAEDPGLLRGGARGFSAPGWRPAPSCGSRGASIWGLTGSAREGVSCGPAPRETRAGPSRSRGRSCLPLPTPAPQLPPKSWLLLGQPFSVPWAPPVRL